MIVDIRFKHDVEKGTALLQVKRGGLCKDASGAFCEVQISDWEDVQFVDNDSESPQGE